MLRYIHLWAQWPKEKRWSHCLHFCSNMTPYTLAWSHKPSRTWEASPWRSSFLSSRRYASTIISRHRVSARPSVCLSHAGIVSKWLNVGSCKQSHMIAQGLNFLMPIVVHERPPLPKIYPLWTQQFQPISAQSNSTVRAGKKFNWH